MIQYLKHREIDKERWDQSIDNSTNRNIYARSWFLDIVSPNWEAIVTEDYSYLMPVPVKKFFGLSYIVQPPLTKQLGIFGLNEIPGEIINEIIKELIKRYRYIRINLNSSSIISSTDNIMIKYLNNHYLNLNNTYELIRKKYKRRTYLNLNRAIKNGVFCKENIEFKDFRKFAFDHSNYFNKKNKKKYFSMLDSIVAHLMVENKVKIFGVYNTSNKLIASNLFFIEHDQVYNIINVSNKEGIATQSMYLLTDYAVQQFTGKYKILDFTGSNIKGIAYFLESFGAEPIKYQYIEVKDIKFPFKLFV